MVIAACWAPIRSLVRRGRPSAGDAGYYFFYFGVNTESTAPPLAKAAN